MFQRKTTIVVGAGAGVDIDMPLGGQLTANIAAALNLRYEGLSRRISGDEAIEFALRQHVNEAENHQDINPHRLACMKIVAGMREAPSIDEFLHTRRGDRRIELCGKLGIVHCILQAERKSKLSIEIRNMSDTIRFENIQQTWLAKFRQFITEGCRKQDVAERLEQVTLIIFNYDRCVEHYLSHSLQNFYTINEQEAAEILKSLRIIHPYGVVGALPWQDASNNIPYGATGNYGRLLSLANGIRTFTEQAEDTTLHDQIFDATQNSELILFLGFAFHDQNVDLLGPDTSATTKKIFATAVNISHADREGLKTDLAHKFCGAKTEAVTLRADLDCYQLFTQYWRTFTRG